MVEESLPMEVSSGCLPGHPGIQVPSILWLCIQPAEVAEPGAFLCPRSGTGTASRTTGSNLGVQEWVCLDTQRPVPVAVRLRGLMHLKALSPAEPELGRLNSWRVLFLKLSYRYIAR